MEEHILTPTGPEFDRHARDYCAVLDASLKFAHESTEDFARQKVDLMLAVIRSRLGDPEQLSALDVGCGTGVCERLLRGRFGRIVAGDVSGLMVEEARKLCPDVTFMELGMSRLPFEDDAFDVQFCCCVYHHVPPGDRPGFVRELARVVRPGGLLFCFEHNPFNPLTSRIVKNCPLDRNAVLLRSAETRDLLRGAEVVIEEQKYYLFFPKFLGFLRGLEPMLGWLPLGGQYYVAARKLDRNA